LATKIDNAAAKSARLKDEGKELQAQLAALAKQSRYDEIGNETKRASMNFETRHGPVPAHEGVKRQSNE